MEFWERRELPQRGVLGRTTPVNDLWSTQFCLILRVSVYFGSWLLATITPKYKEVENIG